VDYIKRHFICWWNFKQFAKLRNVSSSHA
jgi:hypothetical protein